MTYPREPDAPSELTTSRVRGGPSPEADYPEFQRLATDGYQLTVTIAAQQDAALMTIDVVVEPHLSFPNEDYSVVAGAASMATGGTEQAPTDR